MKHSTLLMSSFVALFGLGACDAAMVANQQAAAEAKAEVKADTKVEAKADAKTEGDSGIQGIANGIVADADTKTDTNVNVNVDAKVEVNANIKGEDFDLETINYLIKKNKVKDAKALEKKVKVVGHDTQALHFSGLNINPAGRKIAAFLQELSNGDIIF